MTGEFREPISCTALQRALHALLDGETVALPVEFEGHLATCSTCRADYHAGLALQRALTSRPPVRVPELLTERVVATILADSGIANRRRQRMRRVMVLVAAAACLVLTVLMGPRLMRESTPPIASSNDVVKAPVKPPSITIDDKLSDATTALQSLTRRTTEPTRKLLAARPDAPVLAMPTPAAPPMEPAAQGLTDLGEAAASGLEPLARSARRAFAMFVREIPEQRKPKPDF